MNPSKNSKVVRQIAKERSLDLPTDLIHLSKKNQYWSSSFSIKKKINNNNYHCQSDISLRYIHHVYIQIKLNHILTTTMSSNQANHIPLMKCEVAEL